MQKTHTRDSKYHLIVNLIKDISLLISTPEEETIRLINSSQDAYKRYTIKKKTGGERVIFQPSKATKAIQYSVINLLLRKLPIHDSAMAYRKGIPSPLKRNAELHSRFKYSIRIDFKDYFPSIKPADLVYYLKKNKLELNDVEFEYIKRTFFPRSYISPGLPIGAPGSPIISNIVMFELDEKIDQMSGLISPHFCYTRYADDIIFSSDTKGACADFLDKLPEVLSNNRHPKLTINKEKTLFMSTKNQRRITGLIITPDRKISLGRSYKRYIKSLAFRFLKNNLSAKELNMLKGHLAYIIDNDPPFFNSLVMKYGKDINELLK